LIPACLKNGADKTPSENREQQSKNSKQQLANSSPINPDL
jgi:hypothetical protein